VPQKNDSLIEHGFKIFFNVHEKPNLLRSRDGKPTGLIGRMPGCLGKKGALAMKRFSKVLVLLFLSLFVVSASAIAVPITGGDLQSVLNRWNLDDETDQMEMPEGWVLTTASSGSNMTFYYENPDNLLFGIYSTAGGEEATVFGAINTPVAKSVVSFDPGEILVVNYKDANNNLLATKEYDFTGKAFGFWISDGSKKYYSDAKLNDFDGDGVGGDIALLAYKADDASYVFAGDLDGTGDFDNIVTQAESIKPVPEPATMILFGLGLIGAAGLGRKKLYN